MLSVLSREQAGFVFWQGLHLGTECKAPETLTKESYLLVFSPGSQTFRNLHGRQSGLKTVFHLVLNPTSVQANALMSRNTMSN